VEPELVANLLEMAFRGPLGDEQPLANFAVRETVGHQRRYLALARTERRLSHHRQFSITREAKQVPKTGTYPGIPPDGRALLPT
jgi:hypothetical protein